MILKKVAVALVLLIATALLVMPSMYLISKAQPKKTIPFVGMAMSYQVYSTGASPPLFSRIVTFYGDPSEPDRIWVRDSEMNPDDTSDDRVFKINVETRKIVGEEGYSEALFPTNLQVGDEVTTYWGGTVTILGSQRMSAVGQQIDAWVAYAHLDGADYTMYYEKKTGIWLGGNIVWYDGETLGSWAMHLVSTNAPMFEED